jgi:hypothetical protein
MKTRWRPQIPCGSLFACRDVVVNVQPPCRARARAALHALLVAACSRPAVPSVTPEPTPLVPQPSVTPPPVLNVPSQAAACTGKSCGEPCTLCISEVDPCFWHGGQCDATGDCVLDSTTDQECPMARASVLESDARAP